MALSIIPQAVTVQNQYHLLFNIRTDYVFAVKPTINKFKAKYPHLVNASSSATSSFPATTTEDLMLPPPSPWPDGSKQYC